VNANSLRQNSNRDRKALCGLRRAARCRARNFYEVFFCVGITVQMGDTEKGRTVSPAEAGFSLESPLAKANRTI
jgi:hypothetical protein